MLESYRRITNDILRAHEENVMTFLRSDERFLDCEEEAAEMGLTLSVGIHETYTAETRSQKNGEDGKIPYGYSSELEIDFVRDGRVMMTNPDEGPAVQMSVTATVVRTPETMFIKKIELIPYDELIEDGTLFDGIEDLLDHLEDHGCGIPSPFLCNEDEHTEPTADLSLHLSGESLGDGAYIEYQAGAFTGMFGREDSVYLSRDAELAYKPLYAHILGRRYTPGGILSLDRAEGEQFLEMLAGLASTIPRCLYYGDVLSHLSIYEFTPPGNAERLLTRVTVLRAEEFAETTLRLRDALAKMLESEGSLTIVDL